MTHLYRSKEEYLIDICYPTDAANVFEKIARGFNVCSALEYFLNAYHPMASGTLRSKWAVKIVSHGIMYMAIELEHIKYPKDNMREDRRTALHELLQLVMSFKSHTLEEFVEKYPWGGKDEDIWFIRWINDVVPRPLTNNAG